MTIETDINDLRKRMAQLENRISYIELSEKLKREVKK